MTQQTSLTISLTTEVAELFDPSPDKLFSKRAIELTAELNGLDAIIHGRDADIIGVQTKGEDKAFKGLWTFRRDLRDEDYMISWRRSTFINRDLPYYELSQFEDAWGERWFDDGETDTIRVTNIEYAINKLIELDARGPRTVKMEITRVTPGTAPVRAMRTPDHS